MRRERFLLAVANHSVLIGVSALFMFPIIYMFFTAVQSVDQALTGSIWPHPAVQSNDQALTGSIWPHPFVWSNFKTVFDEINVWRYLWNTFLYAGLSTVGVVCSCVPVAYAFSRIDWRGRNIVFLLVLSTLMLPTQVTSIPLYILWAKQFHEWTGIQFIGTLKPLIIPSFFGDAFSIFLLRQFFLTDAQGADRRHRVHDGGGHLHVSGA